MEVSIVVPTLNRLGDLKRCVRSLESQGLPKSMFEIIVVDNGSSDGSREFLKARADAGAIRFLEQEKPGASAARNLGVRTSKARFIAFTDDDCIAEPGWLAALLAGFPASVRCAGVGGPILSQNPESVISRFWKSRRVWDNMGREGRTVHIPTMNALYLRSALLDVGIFDEGIVGVEDIHLSQKILRKGYELRCLDCGAVRHRDPTDVRSMYRKCYLAGRGSATVAGIYGLKKDGNRHFSLIGLAKSLIVRRGIGDRFVKEKKIPLRDALAYEILVRVCILAMHDGYAYEMKGMKKFAGGR